MAQPATSCHVGVISPINALLSAILSVFYLEEAILPLFFFSLRTAEGLEPDEQGITLPDLETAYLEVCEAIPGVSAEFMSEGVNPLSCSFVISDEAGQALMEVPFAERLRKVHRPVRLGLDRSRRLSRDIADAIDMARETVKQSRAILARSRAS